MANLEITLKRSLIGRTQSQRDVVTNLGLRKINSKAVQPDNEAVRGMINKVSHLVNVKEV
ncbi:50S ribosomal protein L30 [Lacticigenium naphthae]|uniref:50S ribosomal protein L30 n=1 Tax=Lacticigenium naphthae TaxID=515351 RepID=UPI00041244D5|nr:50S ribosomal protein L30 [Lacticigenium naphthae]